MDKLNQASKKFKQSQINTDQALRRVYKNLPILARTRDVFDAGSEFSMYFEVPESRSNIALSLIFSPPPPCGIQSEGCFVGRCDFYYGSTSLVLTTTYEFITETIYAYKNDQTLFATETGANEVTIASRSSTDNIRVCYIYEISGCVEGV